MFKRKHSPEWDHLTKAQATQISEARASQAAAREALKDAAQHLEPDEAFDLLTAHYAARVDAKHLHMVMQRLERAADALRHEAHMEANGANLARMVGGE